MSGTMLVLGIERIEVVTGVEHWRRWSLIEKLKAVEESDETCMTASYVARKFWYFSGLLFRWKKRTTEGGKEAIRTNDT